MESGYLHTTNEYLLTNCRFQGTAKACGNQLKINRIGAGPILHITHVNPYTDDLMLVETAPGKDVFRIKANGEIIINGDITSTMLLKNAEIGSIIYQGNDGDLVGKVNHLRWDENLNGGRCGIGLPVEPLARLDVNGNTMIRGNLQFDSDTSCNTLTKSSCTLDINQGAEGDGLFLGKPDVDGSWRIHIANDGSLMIQKRVGGVWMTRQCVD